MYLSIEHCFFPPLACSNILWYDFASIFCLIHSIDDCCRRFFIRMRARETVRQIHKTFYDFIDLFRWPWYFFSLFLLISCIRQMLSYDWRPNFFRRCVWCIEHWLNSRHDQRLDRKLCVRLPGKTAANKSFVWRDGDWESFDNIKIKRYRNV